MALQGPEPELPQQQGSHSLPLTDGVSQTQGSARRVRRRIDWVAKLSKSTPCVNEAIVERKICVSSKSSSNSSQDVPRGLISDADVAIAARTPSALRTFGAPRVALATCTHGCPAARLREWLFWHLSIGVGPIFLNWEGPVSAEQRGAMQGPIDLGELVLTEAPEKKTSSGSFQQVMCRQLRFATDAMRAARDYGCSFLLHLDDDELLCPVAPAQLVPDILRPHLGSSRICVHFPNYEAVFPFEASTDRPFSRPQIRFRTANQVLYCNGKSAANLEASKEIYCSGVHHFCRHDRSFEPPSLDFGLHDEGGGCTHPDCCAREPRAVVLHFDSPSFAEWQSKFQRRAESTLTRDDREEMDLFPFKRESVKVMRRPAASQESMEDVYRHWRCLPGRAGEAFDARITGRSVEERFLARLALARAAGRPPAPVRGGAWPV